VVSVDVPSGLCATTGYVDNCAVIAESTVTFIALKSGLVTGQAVNHTGDLYLDDLLLGQAFTEQVKSNISILGASILAELPERSPSSHKGDIGLLMAIGGESGFAGAIRLSAEAALRSGAALVSVCCHQSNQALVFNGRPELMLAPSCAEKLIHHAAFNKAKIYVLGPGLGQNDWGRALFDLVLAQNKPCVIDADGLRLLAQNYYQGLLLEYIKHNGWILTPHPGEAAALLDCTITDIERDRFSAVKKISQQYNCICLLKGAGSLISDGQHIWVNTTGNSGMASGGMGDVLSGIIAAMAMQKNAVVGMSKAEKLSYYAKHTALAVYVHGRAADFIAQKHGKIGMLASDLLPVIQQLINNK
jgi:NAD(P)H-hydrate epimerase